MSCSRRDLLRAAAGLALAPGLGCSSNGQGGADASTASCEVPSQNQQGAYCLVEAVIVRVPAAAQLAVGDAVLMNVDDNTAVIVARDSEGLHALSAICTHACCIVSLCKNRECSELTTTPGACEPTAIAAGDQAAESIICPCHGSTFRLADGNALSGPATRPLPSLDLRLDGDDALVDTGLQVDPTRRV